MVLSPRETQSREIAHILYMDIEGSTLLEMEMQRKIYEELNVLVRRTPEYRQAEAKGQVLSRPSGDGMALVFFNDMAAPLRCAMELATTLKSHPHIRLRMGIHSGEVYRVKDINSNTDVTGDGIISAKRVMDCGDAGHILVSSAVAEPLEKTVAWADALHFIGVCEVKHTRHIALWNLYDETFGHPKLPQMLLDQLAQKVLREGSDGLKIAPYWIVIGIGALALIVIQIAFALPSSVMVPVWFLLAAITAVAIVRMNLNRR